MTTAEEWLAEHGEMPEPEDVVECVLRVAKDQGLTAVVDTGVVIGWRRWKIRNQHNVPGCGPGKVDELRLWPQVYPEMGHYLVGTSADGIEVPKKHYGWDNPESEVGPRGNARARKFLLDNMGFYLFNSSTIGDNGLDHDTTGLAFEQQWKERHDVHGSQ